MITKLIKDDDQILIAARELECKTEVLIRVSQRLYDAYLDGSPSWALHCLPDALDHIQLCAHDLRKNLRQLIAKRVGRINRPRTDAN